jgi:ribulose-phosphate 3-epimerase
LKKILISPSLLSADLLNLEKEVRELEFCGVDALHIDVMDGHFVPNLTFGLPIISALKKITSLPLDVHIMVSNPDAVAESYVKAGADMLTFHIEASLHPYRILQSIKKLGAKAGLALNPGTPVSIVEPLRDVLDMVLLLSVNPGFSGQDFIPVVFDKLKAISKWEKEKIPKIIAVDGGVTEKNIAKLMDLGAGYFVTGSYFFKTDKKIALQNLLKAVQ